VVAQEIEPGLFRGDVGDVGAIRVAALRRRMTGDD
jgi:hypothetical protein